MKPLQRILAVLAVAGLALVVAGTASAQSSGSITGISPNSGPTAGGTTVVLTGEYILSASPPTVLIGGARATYVSEAIIGNGPGATVTVVTPPGAAGPADVVLIDSGSLVEKGRLAGGFTYVSPPPPGPAITVTGVSPASGLTTGGEAITITGTGFSGGSVPTVTLGGTAATGVTVVNGTTITATTPARAAGTVDVSVSRDDGTGIRAGA